MATETNPSSVREQAVTLRLAGKSRREIKEIIGPVSNSTLNDSLRGTPPPEWTRRPNAKCVALSGPQTWRVRRKALAI